MAVFPPRKLTTVLTKQLDDFLEDNDFPSLYKSYDWERDTHRAGFPDILRLERQLSSHAKGEGITLQDVCDVASWGKLPNLKGIEIKDKDLFSLIGPLLYMLGGQHNSDVTSFSEFPVVVLNKSVKGIGVTYISKVLMFALPEQYGAIDTRCVRVFGNGDPTSNKQAWLDLKVSKNKDGRWNIPATQRHWPSEYGTWINILRYLAQQLNDNLASCPHPKGFEDAGLRADNAWICADVEMALFAYASKSLKRGQN